MKPQLIDRLITILLSCNLVIGFWSLARALPVHQTILSRVL